MGQRNATLLKSRCPIIAWAKLKWPLSLAAAVVLLGVTWQIVLRPTRLHGDLPPLATKTADRHRDAPADIAWVLRIPDPELRHRHEVVLAAAVPSRAVSATLTNLPPARLKSLYASILMGRWADQDPASASRWAASIPDPESRHLLLAGVANSWSDDACDPAIAWARQLADDADREAALTAIVRTVVVSDPDRALILAADMARPDLARECLRDWARIDPATATHRAMSLPATGERTAVLLDTLTEWARLDPAKAAGFTIDELANDPCFDRAILTVISHGDPADLPMLREWVTAFPESPLKHSARAELTRIERLLHPAPSSLPGETDEERSPLAATGP